MASRKTIYVDSDVLVIGGGFGGCGAAYESKQSAFPFPAFEGPLKTL